MPITVSIVEDNDKLRATLARVALLIDARRGIAMFRRVNVPILGIVENMSTFICPHCGTRSDIFGHGGARHEAERLDRIRNPSKYLGK